MAAQQVTNVSTDGFTYYHVSDALLTPGVRLNTASYRSQAAYKVVRNAYDSGEEYVASLLYADWLTVDKFNVGWRLPTWVTEAIFESVREKDFPGLISRLDVTYLLQDLETARRYIDVHKSGRGFIYQCFAAADCSSNRFDLRHWDNSFDLALPLKQKFESLRESARLYFSTAPSPDPIWEILTTEPVRIVRLVAVSQGGAPVL